MSETHSSASPAHLATPGVKNIDQPRPIDKVKHVMKVDAFIFVVVIIVAMLGVGITDYQGEKAHVYWRYILLVLAMTTTVWGLWRSRELGLRHNSKLLGQQLILWGAAVVAMLIIYQLLNAGRVDFEAAGLLILLILAFTTFIDGMLVSWKLYFVGLLLLLTLLLATYVEEFLWIILLVALVLVIGVVGFIVWKLRQT